MSKIRRTFNFYNTASGKISKPDYFGYAQDKRMIESMPLTPAEYEQAVKKAAARRGV